MTDGHTVCRFSQFTASSRHPPSASQAVSLQAQSLLTTAVNKFKPSVRTVGLAMPDTSSLFSAAKTALNTARTTKFEAMILKVFSQPGVDEKAKRACVKKQMDNIKCDASELVPARLLAEITRLHNSADEPSDAAAAAAPSSGTGDGAEKGKKEKQKDKKDKGDKKDKKTK